MRASYRDDQAVVTPTWMNMIHVLRLFLVSTYWPRHHRYLHLSWFASSQVSVIFPCCHVWTSSGEDKSLDTPQNRDARRRLRKGHAPPQPGKHAKLPNSLPPLYTRTGRPFHPSFAWILTWLMVLWPSRILFSQSLSSMRHIIVGLRNMKQVHLFLCLPSY